MEQNYKISNQNAQLDANSSQVSNPMGTSDKAASSQIDYEKTTERPKYDSDVEQIAEIVRILNNLAPISMPEYNFNANEINGEMFYKPDGTPLLIRDFDSDVIRDYYIDNNAEDPQYSVSRILEHDKNTGRLKVKIEPIKRPGSRLKTGITIFDEKINNKYTIIQLSDGGLVNNISEFSGKGKSFQTLFRNIHTFKPARYIEGKDNNNSFSMIDCIFADDGSIARIKKYNNKKEINIEYTNTQKHITVKNK